MLSAERRLVESRGASNVVTHARFQRQPVSCPLLTKGQLAVVLAVSTRTVDRWVEAGLPEDTADELGAWRYVGSRRRFRQAAVLAWLDTFRH